MKNINDNFFNWYIQYKFSNNKFAQRYDELEDWETFRREYHDAEVPERQMRDEYEELQYYSIGQNEGREENFCWVWRYYGRLDVAQGGTHSHHFGVESRNKWRGWYDVDQELVSIVVPPSISQRSERNRPEININMVPEELIAALRKQFGNNFQIKVF